MGSIKEETFRITLKRRVMTLSKQGHPNLGHHTSLAEGKRVFERDARTMSKVKTGSAKEKVNSEIDPGSKKA